jgi:hypothetical protein
MIQRYLERAIPNQPPPLAGGWCGHAEMAPLILGPGFRILCGGGLPRAERATDAAAGDDRA